MDKKTIGAEIKKDKNKIIRNYKNDIDILDIADNYNVTVGTVCRKLRNWGIKLKKGDTAKGINRKKLKEKKKLKYRKKVFSPELLARMRENTRVNKALIRGY